MKKGINNQKNKMKLKGNKEKNIKRKITRGK
jgi:hypothetical protein